MFSTSDTDSSDLRMTFRHENRTRTQGDQGWRSTSESKLLVSEGHSGVWWVRRVLQYSQYPLGYAQDSPRQLHIARHIDRFNMLAWLRNFNNSAHITQHESSQSLYVELMQRVLFTIEKFGYPTRYKIDKVWVWLGLTQILCNYHRFIGIPTHLPVVHSVSFRQPPQSFPWPRAEIVFNWDSSEKPIQGKG